MFERIIEFDHRAVCLMERVLEFLGDWFALTWRRAAEVLVAVTLACGVTWAWHDHNPGQLLLMLLAGFGLMSSVLAGQQRASLMFRSRIAACARTMLLPFALAHISYFLHHPGAGDDRLLAAADWSAMLLFYLLAVGGSGAGNRRRAAAWERLKAMFGTGWVVTPAPAEK
jgi:hypothetical protein